MKSVRKILVFAFILFSFSAWAEPAGIEAGIKLETGDLLNDNDFALALIPSIGYAIGETGFYVGAEWTMPLMPDFFAGYIDPYEEYGFSVSILDITLGNSNTIYIDPSFDTEGYLYSILGWEFLSLELDFTYLPDFWIAAIFGASYSQEFGKGTFDAGVDVNFDIYEEAGIGDIEFSLGYTFPAGPVFLTVEVDPFITAIDEDPLFGMSALVAATFSM